MVQGEPAEVLEIGEEDEEQDLALASVAQRKAGWLARVRRLLGRM
jgi:hypothetical protein